MKDLKWPFKRKKVKIIFLMYILRIISKLEYQLTDKLRIMKVEHYLNVFRKRERMQDKGITNPSLEIKLFTNEIVKKLSELLIT